MANSVNATKFLDIYNQVDSALRSQNNLNMGYSYTEAVRKVARTNSIVKKYEDKLIDYGRLRNAIVHSSNENYCIAEPYAEVVKEYEKIAELICAPPLAINALPKREIRCVDGGVSLREVLSFMYKSGFSNLPVYSNGMLIGLANGGRIAKVIGKEIYNKSDINEVLEMDIADVVKQYAQDRFYTVVDKKITVDKVMNLFNENSKLMMIIVTPTGSLLEQPIEVIVISDLMAIGKILDDYSL